jgi:hypothetical protein
MGKRTSHNDLGTVHDISRARIVQGLRALHAPFDVYGDCGHNHALNDPYALEIDGEMRCSEGIVETVCVHCCVVDDRQSETCATEHKHLPGDALCPTLAIVEGRESPWRV